MKKLGILLIALPILLSVTKSDPTEELDVLINEWHIAAAQANFNGYFDVTSDDFVFLGTAPDERWTKTEFMAFCKPYFDRGGAWDFKPSQRKWNFSKNGKTAWFDEDLDTWMRGCRGTGIAQKIKGEWKIVYYNLHVLIENEKIQSFIELRDAPLPTPTEEDEK